jgi:hypothetical protein
MCIIFEKQAFTFDLLNNQEVEMKLYKLLSAMLTIVILLSFMVGCGDSTSTATTSANGNIPSNFQSYSADFDLFSIAYPDHWELTDSMVSQESQISDALDIINGGFTISYTSVVFEAGLNTGSGYYPIVNISVEPSGPAVMDLEDEVEYLIETLRNSAPDLQVVSQTPIKSFGKDATLIEFKGTFSGGLLMHDLMLVYMSGTNVWSATCTAKDADYSQYADVFNSIVRSFQVNKWPGWAASFSKIING